MNTHTHSNRHWKFVLMLALFGLLCALPAMAQSESGSTGITTLARPWLNAVGYLMIAGAAICFIFTAYEAFQREWNKALIGLLVCVILGFAPAVLRWVATQWGVSNGSTGTGTQTLFMK